MKAGLVKSCGCTKESNLESLTKNVLSSLNKESLQLVKNGSLKEQTPSYKLFTLLNIALDKLVDEKYEAIV